MGRKRGKKHAVRKPSPHKDIAALDKIPNELLGMVCSYLPPEDLKSLRLVSTAMDRATSIYFCERIGPNLVASDFSPDLIVYLDRYRYDTKGLFLDPTIFSDIKKLKDLLAIFANVPLRVLTSYPHTVIYTLRARNNLDAHYEKHRSTAEVLVVPRLLDTLGGWLTGIPSIVTTTDEKSGKTLRVITRFRGDTRITRTCLRQEGRKIQEVSFFSPPQCYESLWPNEVAALGQDTPLQVESLSVYGGGQIPSPSGIFSLPQLKRLAFFYSACDTGSALSQGLFWARMAREKCDSGSREMEQLISVSSTHTGDELACVSESLFDFLTEVITGVKTLCWHQPVEYEGPLPHRIRKWASTLVNLSIRNGGNDWTLDEITNVLRQAKKLESVGMNYNFTGLKMNGQKYGSTMDHRVKAKAKEFAEAVFSGAGKKHFRALAFFIKPSVHSLDTATPEQYDTCMETTTCVVKEIVWQMKLRGITVELIHLVPRAIAWPAPSAGWQMLDPAMGLKQNDYRIRPPSAISYRIRYAPEGPMRWASSRPMPKDSVVVSNVKHLSPEEHDTLHLLGGSDDVFHEHVEQTLVQECLPRHEDAKTYTHRVYGTGPFVARSLLSFRSSYMGKRKALDSPGQEKNKSPRLVENGSDGNQSGGRGRSNRARNRGKETKAVLE